MEWGGAWLSHSADEWEDEGDVAGRLSPDRSMEVGMGDAGSLLLHRWRTNGRWEWQVTLLSLEPKVGDGGMEVEMERWSEARLSHSIDEWKDEWKDEGGDTGDGDEAYTQ